MWIYVDIAILEVYQGISWFQFLTNPHHTPSLGFAEDSFERSIWTAGTMGFTGTRWFDLTATQKGQELGNPEPSRNHAIKMWLEFVNRVGKTF
jgi:hypothetical protein